LSVVLRDLRKSFEPQRTRAPVAACSARFVGVERQVMTECPAGGQSLTGEQARWQSLAVFESVEGQGTREKCQESFFISPYDGLFCYSGSLGVTAF